MDEYRRIKILIISILIAYSIVGIILQLFVSGRNEIFPVFSWALFSRVPNKIIEYNIVITSVDGQPLHTVLTYNKASEWFTKSNSINAYYVIQTLGRAVYSGDANQVKEVRKYFEPLYLGDVNTVEYELIKLTIDPLKLKKYGLVENIQNLASFEYNKK